MRKLTIIISILMVMLLASCQAMQAPVAGMIDTTPEPSEDHVSATNSENATELPMIPAIECFSGTELELEKLYGCKILSATMKYAENEMEISVDDPRLIRLLNLLFYSEKQRTTWMLQGLILDAEIQDRLAVSEPTLDITMQPSSEPDGFLSKSSRIVICKEMFMIIYEGHLYYEGLVAEEFYPFHGLIPYEMLDDPRLDSKWGEDGWINLLEHAGFE